MALGLIMGAGCSSMLFAGHFFLVIADRCFVCSATVLGLLLRLELAQKQLVLQDADKVPVPRIVRIHCLDTIVPNIACTRCIGTYMIWWCSSLSCFPSNQYVFVFTYHCSEQ